MSRPRIVPCLLVLALACAAASAADDATKYRLKPGAGGKVCLSCHVDFEQTLARRHVHTPVKAGNCAECHDPHASDHGKLLAAEPSAICLTCHSGVVPQDPVSAHESVVEGRCIDCHDPHASDFENGLRAQGNALCLGCHESLAGAIASAEHEHAPVEADCLRCHTPHASAEGPALIAKSVPGLCLQCHDGKQDPFRRAHMGYPVAQSDCTSCHDPHGSKNAGILWANVHEPVSRKLCAQCHAAPDSPEALEAKRPGGELCRGCHSELFNDAFGKRSLHWPMVDRRGCANCHNPHASKTSKLLAAAPGELCGSCHQDAIRRQRNSKTQHPPNAEGECVACHAPHSSNEPFLFSASELEVCGACHDWGQHSAHPMGEKAVDPRNANLTVGCLSCHQTHGTPFEKLAHFEPKQDLCVQCHVQVSR